MRGKAAAQNANRRTAEALENVARLEAKLAEQTETHALTVRALKTDLEQMQNKLTREIDQRSKSAIQGAEERATEQVAAVRADSDRRVWVTLSFLSHYITDDSLKDHIGNEDWLKFAEAVRMSMIDIAKCLGVKVTANRDARRIRSGHGRSCPCGCKISSKMITGDLTP